MPVFESNGKKWNVPEERIDAFMKENPDAFTVAEKDGKRYRVDVGDYKRFKASFGGETQTQDPFDANVERMKRGEPTQRITTQSMIDAHPELGLGGGGSQSFSVNDSEIERLQGIKDTAQKQIDEAGFFDRFFDADTRAAVAARNQAEEALEMYDEAKHADEGWFDRNVMGVLRGIGDKAGDLATWDFGASGWASGYALKDVTDKLERGEKLSASEQNMLDAFGLASAVQAAYQDKVGMAYKVGQSLPESAAFMGSLVLNPAAGAGRKIAQSAAKAAVKKYGASMVSKLAKGAARVGGDALEMAVATAVPGAGRVAEDYYNRVNGQSTFDIDENGIIRYGGQVEQEAADDAIWKAFGSQFIENYSESVGNYFAPMGQMLSNLTSKGLKAAHLGKLADVVNDISSSQFSRGLKRFKDATKFDGFVGEYLEEVAGNFMNAATVGDMNFHSAEDPNSVFNVEMNVQTALSCALMSGTMYAVEAPVSVYNRRIAKRNLDNADKEAEKYWGSAWGDMRSMMDEADGDDMMKLVMDAVNAPNLSKEQKESALKYAERLMQYQGYNARKMQNQMESTDEANAINKAYDEGSELQTAYDKHSAKRVADKAEEALAQDAELAKLVIEGGNNPVATVNAMAESGKYTEAQIKLAKDYYTAVHRMNGLTAALIDEVDSQIESADNEVDANTNKDNGSVTKVILRDGREGYVVEGSVNRTEKGLVDVNGSDETVMVRLQSGEEKMMNPNKDLYGVAWIDSPEKLKADNHAVLREKLIDQAIGEIDWNPATPNPKVGDSFEMGGVPVTIVSHDGKGGMFVVPTEEYQSAVGSEQKMQQLIAKAQQQQPIPASEYKNWASAQLDAQEDAQAMAQQEAASGESVGEQVNDGVNAPVNTEAQQPVEEKRPMTEDEAAELISRMGANAEPMPTIEFTPENWQAAFGENGTIETPIGIVKMGENQISKLFLKKRTKEFGMIAPTLSNPDVIIEEASKSKEGSPERESSYLFVKTFIKDGQKIRYYTSVTVLQDGMEVSVSSHVLGDKQVPKKLVEGNVLYIKEALSSNSSDGHLAEQPNAVPDLLPTQENNASLSTNKDSDKNVQSQENKQDFVAMGVEKAFKVLGEKYGEKMPKKVEVTAKALAKDLKKAENAMYMAQNDLDNAPIGREDKPQAKLDKAKQDYEAVKREADFWAEMDAEIKNAQAKREAMLNPQAEVDTSNEPMTADEFIAQQLAVGNIVLSKEDYMAQTGYGKEEVKAMNGGAKKLLTDNGMTLDEAGERLMEMDRENGTNFFDQADSNAGRDALISLLGSVKSRKELNQYVAENRKAQAAKESEGLRNEAEKQVMSANYSSLEDFVLQMEASEMENPFLEDRADEIMAIFAEEAAKYEQSINNTENGQGTTNEASEGSDTVLPEESSDDTGGTETDNESASVGNGIGEEGEGAYDGEQANEVEDSQKRILDVFGEAARIAAKNRREQIKARVKMWEAAGVKVKVHERTSGIHNMDARRAIMSGEIVAGWYDGEVHIYLPYVSSMAELDKTILHEAISHKGLRDLMGEENFDKLCDKVWEMMPQSAKDEFINYPGVNGDEHSAADEYMAHLAEDENLSPEEKSLWQKIVQWFKDLFTTKVDEKEQAVSILNQSRLTNKDISELLKLSYANLKNGIQISDFGGKVEGEGVRFNIRTNSEVVENREKQLKRSVRNGILSKKEADEIREASEAMLEIAEVIAQAEKEDGTAMFPSFSQWNGMEVRLNANGMPAVSVLKSNGDYAMNIDFAKDCIKRDATNRVLNRLAQVAPEALTSMSAEQLTEINNIIKRHGLSVPCVGCFVEARRYRSADFARSVVNVWNALVDAVGKGGKAIEAAKKEFGNKVSVDNIITHLQDNPNDMVQLSESDIVSPDKYAALMIEHPQVPQLLQGTQGQNNPHLVVPEAIYYGDVLKLEGEKAWDVDAAYAVGGVRIQSFSDFKAKLFFDYCQVLADLASKKLPAHSYTKVPSFAELFGLTGVKINLSLYFEGTGLDSNGEYQYSSESISPEFAYEIQTRDGYTENVGTMAIGVSDAHIWKMMKDPNIRSISPYHKSGINAAVAKKIDASRFVDYSNEQNAVIAKAEKMENETFAEYYARIAERKDGTVPKYGLKTVPKFNLYDDLLNTEDPVQTAMNYVEHCQQNGIVPKFPSFVYNPDGSFNNEYYKLIYDFAVTDKDGVYAPQGAVKWNEEAMPANTAEILTSALEVEEATIARNEEEVDSVVIDILNEVVGEGTRFSVKPYGSDNPYHNKRKASKEERAEIINTIIHKKYQYKGTDIIKVGNYLFLIDHTDAEDLFDSYLNSGEILDGFGYGIRKKYNFAKIDNNDLYEIISNISKSYNFNETSIRKRMQDVGLEPRNLLEPDFAAAIRAGIRNNAMGDEEGRGRRDSDEPNSSSSAGRNDKGESGEDELVNSTRFRISTYGKTIKEEVDRVTSKYNSKDVMFFDKEMTDEEVSAVAPGYTAADIKPYFENGILGGYSTSMDKISIFANNNPVYDVEDTIFHENLHALLAKKRGIIDAFAENALSRFPNNVKKLKEAGYPDEEVPEELLVRLATKAMAYGIFDDVAYNLPEREFDELKELLNEFGYGYEQEIRSRALEEGRRGTPTLLGGEEIHETRGIRQDAEGIEGKKAKGRARKEELGKLLDQVADMGLEGVLGNKEYSSMMVDIFKALPEKVRTEISDDAIRLYGGSIAPAVSDYIGPKSKDSLMDKVVTIVREALRKIGIDIDLNANEVRYMAWRSKKPLDRRHVLEVAEDMDMRHRLKVGEYAGTPSPDVGGTRFRVSGKLNVRDKYEATVRKGGYQAREAVQDAMLSLRRFQELIEEASGKAVRGFENAWWHENRMSSMVQAAIHEMERKVYKPMMDAVKKLMNAAKLSEHEVADYLMLKHGIERNREMAVRKALTDSDGKIDRTRLEQWYQDKRNVRSRTATPHLDTWRKQQEELDNIALMYGADMSRDYSGLTSMFDTDDLADSTQKAYDEVEAIETAHSAETEALGKAVKAMTQDTLDYAYESGLMDKKVYDELSHDMYDYYIPLRGFDETTSDEVYAYLDQDRNAFNAPLKRAKGRSSKADNPLAYMKSIAESGIMQGNRNKMKQSFLALVMNRPSDLISVKEGVWAVLNPATGEWEAASVPPIPDNATPADVEAIMTTWDEQMELRAQSDPDNVRKISEADDVPYRVIGNRMNQHQVLVRWNGKSYTLTVNGNPRLAMALNGLTNPNNTSNDGKVAADVQKAVNNINRQLASWYTTRNPDFVASNFMRDTFYTNTIVRAKEGNRYANQFHKHYAKLLMPGRMLKLFRKWENGTLDTSNPMERDFYEFMMNGGETGYSNLKDMEEIKKQISKELKGGRWKDVEKFIEKFDLVNRAVENTARFAAYRTSKQMGRATARAIFDAKEISVNFNKKGAGGTFYKGVGQTKLGNMAAMVGAGGRALYVFFNAAIQGTTNIMHVMKKNKKGTGAGLAAMFLMGAVVPMLFGDDDEKDYYDLPEHVRRNHLILPGFGDAWISIPLPIEYRIMYGAGELLTSWRTGHEKGENIGMKMLNLTGQALPLNFLEEGMDAFIPSALSPLWQVYNNKSWTGLPIYKDNEFNKDDPEYTKAYKNVNRLVYNFTKALYDWTFDEESQKEGINLNPAVIEHLAKGYFGGLVTTLDNVWKTGEMIAGSRDFDWRNVPVVNRTVKTGDERTKEKKVQNEYFENLERLDFLQSRKRLINKTMNGAAVPEEDKADARKDFDALINSNSYKEYMKFNEKKKQIDKLRKAMKEQGASDELNKRLNAMMESANNVISE